MNRQDRYPDTTTFHFHNENPKNRITGDCVIRAIATATGMTYEEVVMSMAEYQCKTGYDARYGGHLDGYMKSLGWIKHKQPKKANGTKYTGSQFCRELDYGYGIDTATYHQPERIVAHIGGHHTVAIKEIKCKGKYRFKVFDIWDSTDGCIGNYWTKA